MNEPWIRLHERLPELEDCDAQGCVLAWHRFNGVMVVHRRNIEKNHFITHWMPTPKAPLDADKN